MSNLAAGYVASPAEIVPAPPMLRMPSSRRSVNDSVANTSGATSVIGLASGSTPPSVTRSRSTVSNRASPGTNSPDTRKCVRSSSGVSRAACSGVGRYRMSELRDGIRAPPPDHRPGRSRAHFLPVHADVASHESGHVLDDVRLRDAVEGAVDHAHIGDRALFVPAEVQPVVALLARDSQELYVPDDRWEAAVCPLLVQEVDLQHGVGELPDGDVPHVDVLERTAAHRIVLEPEGAVELWAVHAIAFRVHVADAARDLAADRHATVPVPHLAVAHDDVLARHVDAPAVRVASGFDRDAVVSRIEHAALDQHVPARLGITSIVVGAVTADAHVAHDHVAAEHRVDLPHRGVPDRHSLDQNVRASVGLDERRSQEGVNAEAARCDWNALLRHLKQPGPCRALIALTLLPAVAWRAVPVPPDGVAGLAIEGSPAGDGDVDGIAGIDQRRQSQ